MIDIFYLHIQTVLITSVGSSHNLCMTVITKIENFNKMASTIIANSNIVFFEEYLNNKVFMYNWRKHSIKAITKNHNFKVTDSNVNNYLDSKNINNIIKKDKLILSSNLQEILASTNIENTKIIMFDNSYVCNNLINLEFLTQQICTDSTQTYIIIHSFVQSNEIDYKLATDGLMHLKQFDRNTINNLNEYKNTISILTNNSNENIKLLNIPFSISNDILSNLELEFIKRYNNQFPRNIKVRNEINDNFHIQLLKYSKMIFNINDITIITDDLGMKKKANNNKIHVIESI